MEAEIKFDDSYFAKINEVIEVAAYRAVVKALQEYLRKPVEETPKYLSLKEVCMALSRSRPTVYKLIKEGRLTRHFISGHQRSPMFLESEVLQLVQKVQFKYMQR